MFEGWHDFLMLIGTAAATLTGLMFVAASVGTRVFTPERQVPLRTFLSPTVVAFAAVLFVCLLAVSPLPAVPMAVGIAVVGLTGAAYSAQVWRTMRRHGIADEIGLEDRLWYAVAPAVGYGSLVIGAPMLALGKLPTPFLLAGALALLLLAGIRNAWDMTVWIVLRHPE